MEVFHSAGYNHRPRAATFLCMINDALSNRDHQVWKYVDDLTIGENRVCGASCNLQPSLDSLSSWSQENKLKLNPTKCQAMRVYFGNKEIPNDDLFITNQQLAAVDKMKLLGFLIRDDLKWNGQVENICTKANQKFFMLHKLKEAGFTVCSPSLAPRPYSETSGPCGEHPEACLQARSRLGVYIIPDSLAELELESLEDRRLDICRELAVKCYTSGQFSRWFTPSEYWSRMTLRKQRKLEFVNTKQTGSGAAQFHSLSIC